MIARSKKTPASAAVDRPTRAPESFEPGRAEVEIPATSGVGTIEVLDLPMGIRLSQSSFHVIESVERCVLPAHPSARGATADALVVVSVPRGRIEIQLGDNAPALGVGGGRDAFIHVTTHAWHARLPVSRLTAITTLHIDVQALEEMLDEEHARRLLEGLGILAADSGKVVAVPSTIGTILHTCMKADLSGPARRLHAHARVLEYISELSQHLVQAPFDPQNTSRRARALALRRELMTLKGTVPRLESLATMFGVSARALNEDFRQVYGQSIYSFFTDNRLSEAHAAILGSDVPLKRIAADLGYSHVNHFSSAFRRKFGYPPGQLRRRREK